MRLLLDTQVFLWWLADSRKLGKAARDAAGWHTCLDALESSLAGEADPRSRMQSDRWSEVHPHYVESFGPEASALGPPEGYNG